MVLEAADKLGGIDVLVNNAGTSGPTAPVQDLEPDQWEQVLQVNLNGTFLATKYAIPYLIRSGSGVIIIMSSAAGRFGYPNRSAYSTAKWGLIGFMKTLSIELGPHDVRVNAILPGAVQGIAYSACSKVAQRRLARAPKKSRHSQWPNRVSNAS
jgi:NAD(P)-dependent dehydrogenase (short-subunit alcohol dehydrogenase family)